jgi:hypothetical protein
MGKTGRGGNVLEEKPEKKEAYILEKKIQRR